MPESITKIFKPIFTEMKEYGQKLNIVEFVDASFRLYETLNLIEKDAIITFHKCSKKSMMNSNIKYEFVVNYIVI